jgi:branched-subunit amino acid transport protein
MDIRPEIAWLVLACAAVTALPRVLPLVALSRVTLPDALMAWLRHVPVAVLAALLAIEAASFSSAGYVGIAAALAVAFATRSLIATVAIGVAVFWLLG